MTNKFEVGKYYVNISVKSEDIDSRKRKCLFVTATGGALLDKSGAFPVETFVFHDAADYWKEYSPPVVLKVYIPVVKNSATNHIFFSYVNSAFDKKLARMNVEATWSKQSVYKLIDVIEVTWTEGDSNEVAGTQKVCQNGPTA